MIGVEGTGSYGAGLTRHLHDKGMRVVEVDRPNRQERRRAGKSDPLDAVEAARAALSGRAKSLANYVQRHFDVSSTSATGDHPRLTSS